MKTIIILLALLCVGCSLDRESKTVSKPWQPDSVVLEKTVVIWDSIYTIVHGNHTYVYVHSSSGGVSMLHHPDCPCGRGGK